MRRLAATSLLLTQLACPVSAYLQDLEIEQIRAAAEQGDAEAQFNLGVLHYSGELVPQDDAESARWVRSAAEQGHLEAQYFLALRYDEGRGVPQDSAEAARWYLAAARRGNGDAQFALGRMYTDGRGVRQDLETAYLWVELAASHIGEEKRETVADFRDSLAAKMTPAQVAEAQRGAREGKPAPQ